jgi:hypothetical protein
MPTEETHVFASSVNVYTHVKHLYTDKERFDVFLPQTWPDTPPKVYFAMDEGMDPRSTVGISKLPLNPNIHPDGKGKMNPYFQRPVCHSDALLNSLSLASQHMAWFSTGAMATQKIHSLLCLRQHSSNDTRGTESYRKCARP